MDIYQVNGVNQWQLHEMSTKRKIWLFIDENLAVLAPAFRDAGFRVEVPLQGMSDDEIKEKADNMLVVTKNSKDFLQDASIFDYDVVSIEPIKFIDSDQKRTNKTVRKIAAAIMASKIWHLVGHFQLIVNDDGTWQLKKL